MKLLQYLLNRLLFLLFLACSINLAFGQDPYVDSLKAIINQQKADTTEVRLLAYVANHQTNNDSGIAYAEKGISLAKSLNDKEGEARNLLVRSLYKSFEADFRTSLQDGLTAHNMYREQKDNTGITVSCLILQGQYRELGDYRKALDFGLLGQRLAESYNVISDFAFPNHRLATLFMAENAQSYVLMKQLDSAQYLTQRSIDQKELFNGAEWGFTIYLLATIQNMQGHYISALENYRRSIPLSIQNGFAWDTLQIYSGMSTLFRNTGQVDSAIHYAQIVAENWTNESEYKNLLEATSNLAQVYRFVGNSDSALKYMMQTQAVKDSIFSREKERELQNMAFNDQLKQQKIIAVQKAYKSKIQSYLFMSGLILLLLIAALLWRNNRNKQKAKEKVEKAYGDLKATQAQLIQSEKMASLGELTAGIAHEIQNPLNFVNNFSEVSNELIVEMKTELEKDNRKQAIAIAEDIRSNLEKILSHGKRADSIVKGMLQHSSSGKTQKELTDINNLVDEFVRLSYHGLRAKDKSFNVVLETDLDEQAGKIGIIAQDIGRVLLNLYNNAFYSTSEKKKRLGETYTPTVSISTKRNDDKVEITVKDNGNGIPQKVIDKIFQPFFTTKPTGQGTGLGLSLSYDIVKSHGGDISVETREGEGAVFRVKLPG